uniref:Expansin n=1 Tax=Oryza punctata TaxID=4537 RepID=A0A0E0MNB2_ORYPU
MAPLPLLTTSLLLLASFADIAIVVVAAGGGGGGAKKPHVNHGRFKEGPWVVGHATFYGGRDGSGTTEGGACGYKDADGYGALTAAVSPTLFDKGAGCGACYEVKGESGKAVVVTATNQAPPPVNGMKGEHFDLTMPAVACVRQGGIKYTITGNPSYNMVMVKNVGGAGDVVKLMVKGNKRVKWTPLQRSWGQLWKTEANLTGESLTFRVMTGDHRKATSWHVAPRDWTYDNTYQAKKNF